MRDYYRKRRKAFGYAITGLLRFLREEDHAKIHLLAAAVVVLAGWWLQVTTWEWIALLLCMGSVISLEAVNSSIEQLTDIASPDYLEAAGRVKDLAAGAVLVAALVSAIVGGIIFIPKILELI
jgi:diacylglycerol kinase